LSSILVALAVLSLLAFVHELGHLIAAKATRMHVEEFGLGYPPRLLSLGHLGGTCYTFNWLFFGAFVRLSERGEPGTVYSEKGKLARAVFFAGGPVCNLLLSVLLFSICFATGWPVPHDLAVGVNKVLPGSVAQAVGFEDGDLILAANGRETTSMLDLIIYSRSVDGDIRTVTLRRRGRRFNLDLPAGAAWFVKPETRGVQLRDAAGWEELVSYPWPLAIKHAVERTAGSVGFLYSIPIRLLRGLIPMDVVRPVGPVGIAQLTGQAARQSAASGGWFPLLQLIATLSSALAVTNLLPLPGLDGGHLLFIGAEALRGQRLDPRRENLVHLVGLIVMLMLILMVTYHDFAAPYPFGR